MNVLNTSKFSTQRATPSVGIRPSLEVIGTQTQGRTLYPKNGVLSTLCFKVTPRKQAALLEAEIDKLAAIAAYHRYGFKPERFYKPAHLVLSTRISAP